MKITEYQKSQISQAIKGEIAYFSFEFERTKDESAMIGMPSSYMQKLRITISDKQLKIVGQNKYNSNNTKLLEDKISSVQELEKILAQNKF